MQGGVWALRDRQVLRNPLAMTAGNSGWALFAAARAFLPAFRELGHRGLCVEHIAAARIAAVRTWRVRHGLPLSSRCGVGAYGERGASVLSLASAHNVQFLHDLFAHSGEEGPVEYSGLVADGACRASRLHRSGEQSPRQSP